MSLSTNVSPNYNPPVYNSAFPLKSRDNPNYFWASQNDIPVYLYNRNGFNMAVGPDLQIRGYFNKTNMQTGKLYEIFLVTALTLANFTNTVGMNVNKQYITSSFELDKRRIQITFALKALRSGYFVCYNPRRKVFAKAVANKKKFPKTCMWGTEQTNSSNSVYDSFRHLKYKRHNMPLYLKLDKNGFPRVTKKKTDRGTNFLSLKVPKSVLSVLKSQPKFVPMPQTGQETIPIPPSRLHGCHHRKHPKKCRTRRRMFWRIRLPGKRKKYCDLHRKRYRRRRGDIHNRFVRTYRRICLSIKLRNKRKSSPSNRRRIQRRSSSLLKSWLQT